MKNDRLLFIYEVYEDFLPSKYPIMVPAIAKGIHSIEMDFNGRAFIAFTPATDKIETAVTNANGKR